jgi:hypothetical protein
LAALLYGQRARGFSGTGMSFALSLVFVMVRHRWTTNSTKPDRWNDGTCSVGVAIAAMAFAMLNINFVMMYRFSDMQEPIRAATQWPSGATLLPVLQFQPREHLHGRQRLAVLGFNMRC